MAHSIQDAAAKWAAAMANPATAQNYVNGVTSYTGNPMAEAAAQEALYLQNVTEASQSGRRVAALMATPVASWQNGVKNKGAQSLAAGAKQAMSKVQAHFAKFGPVYAQIRQTVASMPKGGQANAMARVAVAYQMLRQAAGKPV